MIDRTTRYIVSCAFNSKKEELMVKKVFQYSIRSFEYSKRIFVKHGGGLYNEDLKQWCKKFNTWACTSAA